MKYLVVSSLFNFCNEIRGSSVHLFWTRRQNIREKRRKKFSVTSQKCWRPSYFSKNCNSQFLLTAIHFWNTNPLKNVALSTCDLLCNWWELQNLSSTENQTYQSCSLASFDGNNNMPWGIQGALLKIPAPKWREVSVGFFASGAEAVLWGRYHRLTWKPWTHMCPLSCDGMGAWKESPASDALGFIYWLLGLTGNKGNFCFSWETTKVLVFFLCKKNYPGWKS